MLEKINPTDTEAWRKLENLYNSKGRFLSMSNLFSNDHNRFESFHIKYETLLFDFSKNIIDKEIFTELINLVKEVKIQNATNSLFKGDKINETENRAVLHVNLRSFDSVEFNLDNKNISSLIWNERLKIKNFCQNIHDGNFKGFTGKSIKKIVNIGIGGSDLGPKMVVEALKSYWIKGLSVEYVSNVDSNQIIDVLANCNPEETLFIIVSKTFTTQETITNAAIAKDWLLSHFQDSKSIENHFIAVSSNIAKASEFGIGKENIFEIWDWVGGRFSLWGSVGISIALMIGYSNFEQLLKGAEKIDKHFKESDPEKNIPIIMGVLGVWYNNFFNYNIEAVLPYNEKLNKFPAYLQQTMMESNGKEIDRNGKKVNYKTCPAIMGEVGTNAQHSFFQLLHQGTSIIPGDFIFFKQSEEVIQSQQDILFSNFISQTEALCFGKSKSKSENSNQDGILNETSIFKTFEGNRPTNSLIFSELTPNNIGMLIALYEHKTFVQGIIWNIFSFDQWGVELGKVLAKEKLDFLANKSNLYKFDSSTENLIEAYLKK